MPAAHAPGEPFLSRSPGVSVWDPPTGSPVETYVTASASGSMRCVCVALPLKRPSLLMGAPDPGAMNPYPKGRLT